MSQTYNSQNRSQLANNNSNLNMSSRGITDLQQAYEATGFEFVPPQHKYIELSKFQSPFYNDNNEEEYVLQRAFQANNFTYLRNLPDNFSRNCILDERKERVKGQMLDQTTKRMRTPLESQQAKKTKIDQIKRAKIGTLGYFQIFPYKQSDYELPKKLATKQKQQKDQKRKQINEMDFRPAGFERKMKYEDPFRYVDRLNPSTSTGDKYIFPFHLPEDVYDAFRESQKRKKIVQNELKIAGEFYPSQKQYSLGTVSKAKMPQILNQIEFYFKKYLKSNYGYFIGVSKRDHIEIMFQSKFADDPILQMAMSGILEHQILSKFVLRRNFERWGTINDTTKYLEFFILPPWVKDPQQKLKAPNTATTNKSNSTLNRRINKQF